jgi:hypothetical protein
MLNKLMIAAVAAAGACVFAGSAQASTLPETCVGIGASQAASYNSALKSALSQAVQSGINGGLGFNMWATAVANDGSVCAVAFSGNFYTDQWLASRVISAQKAATANSLSLSTVGGASSNGKLALSTANLYSPVRDGGSLFGLQFSNPVDPADAYHNPDGSTPNPFTFGSPTDPMIGRPIGGVNVFGGGLALFNNQGQKVGGIGVSGDTSCTDHMVAWQVRHLLAYDFLATGGVGGVSGDNARPDNIVFDIAPNAPGGTVGNNRLSVSGWGHPTCLNTPNPALLPPVR